VGIETPDQLTAEMIKENPIVSRCYAFNEGTQHFFVKDKEHPYIQHKPFDWIRGYQVGGKSLMWADGRNAGVILILKRTQSKVLGWIGRSGIRILLRGILM
jgi:hypothetical protein